MLEFLITNNMVCRATEAMLFASIGCAVLSVLITQMKISAIGFTMAHGAFAGAAVGMFFGIEATIAALIGSFVLASILGPLHDKARMPLDTVIGVLFGSMMAIAIFFYSLMQQMGIGYNASALLFGSVISLYREEIYGLLIIVLFLIVFVGIFYKEISAMIFHMKIAEITGIRTKPMMYALLFMIALMVALTLPIVGGLLMYVWLVAPAAIAYQFCGTLKQMMIAAPLVAAGTSLAGVFISFSYNFPVAPFSAVLFAIVFAIAVMISPKRKVIRDQGL
jgi:zinc/manganese transport system permease protein